MNTIMKKSFNCLKGFEELKVQTIVGKYAIVVNQKDQFIGIINEDDAINKEVILGKISTSTKKIEVVSHASYKSSRSIDIVSQEKSGIWGRNRENDQPVMINNCYNTTVGNSIAANVIAYMEIPWITIAPDSNNS